MNHDNMRTTIIHNGILYKSGDAVVVKIYQERIEDARIYINDDKLWICHNSSSYDGDRSPDRLGFRYSWAFHQTEQRLSDDVTLITNLNSNVEYRINTKLSDDLYFFSTSVCSNVHQLLYAKYCLPLYNLITVSNKKGMLCFSNTDADSKHKTIEIKIGRYITQTVNQHNANCKESDKITLSLKDIELIVTKYIAFQSKDYDFSYLIGDDIYIGYDNQYQVQASTLSKSCMNGKKYLGLYTKNIDVVKLLVLKNEKELIIGRALIWKLNDGSTYMDRVYYAYEYINTLFQNKAKSEGWKYFGDGVVRNNLTVNITYTQHDYYPYVDTFCYMVNNTLNMSLPDNIRSYSKLRSTSGTRSIRE